MKKLANLYNKLEEYLLVGSLAFTVVLIFVQVVLRYVFNSSLTWSEELTRYIFIWQIWMGTSIAFRDKKHIVLEVISGKLKGRGKIAFAILADLIWLFFCVYIVIGGFDLTASMARRGALSTGLRMPLQYVYAALPVSQLVVCIRIVAEVVGYIKELFGKGKEEMS